MKEINGVIDEAAKALPAETYAARCDISLKLTSLF